MLIWSVSMSPRSLAVALIDKGAGDEPRVGLAILGAERAADGGIAEERIARAKLLAVEELELESVGAHGIAIRFELGHLGGGARELDVAARHELAIGADDLGETTPHFA